MSHNISSNVFDFLNKTNELLLEMPLYKKMKSHNDELKEKVKALKYTIEYLELINKNLTNKNKKLKMKLKTKTCHVSQQFNGDIFEDVNEDIFEDVNEDIFEDVNEDIFEDVNKNVEIEITNDDPNIKMEIVELEKAIDYNEDSTTKDKEVEEEEAEVEATEEEVEATEEEEEATEEEVEATEEEEEATEEEEEATEEEVEATEEEEEATEEEVEATEEEVEATEEEVEAEEEEADVYEVTIKGKTYYVSNEVDSIIYAADENGDISIEAGMYKNGKPVFNKTK
jgi:chromosome segregation ATPase